MSSSAANEQAVGPAQPANGTKVPRDAGNWAGAVHRLHVAEDRADAPSFNVTGRRVNGPQQGFGRLWQKTYSVDIGDAAAPDAAIATWKAHFGEFWPHKGRFFGAVSGIAPGDVAPLTVSVGGGFKLATGVLVLYADEESFTFMTPQGHMFGAWITFSAAKTGAGTTLQIQILLRASDPLYELGMPIMVRQEDRFWLTTLANLAGALGVAEPVVTKNAVLVDKRRLWRNARNVWHNAGIRSAIHALLVPFFALGRAVRRAGRGRTSA